MPRKYGTMPDSESSLAHTCLILPGCLTKGAFNVCFAARLMEASLRSEKWRFLCGPVVVPERLLHPIAHPVEWARLTHQLYPLQPHSRSDEKPIANFLLRSRQRFPSNRSIRPAPRCLLAPLRFIARSSSDRVLTFYVQVDRIC